MEPYRTPGAKTDTYDGSAAEPTAPSKGIAETPRDTRSLQEVQSPRRASLPHDCAPSWTRAMSVSALPPNLAGLRRCVGFLLVALLGANGRRTGASACYA